MESMVINILDIISYYIVLLDFVFVFVIYYKYKYKVEQYKSHESNKYKGRRVCWRDACDAGNAKQPACLSRRLQKVPTTPKRAFKF